MVTHNSKKFLAAGLIVLLGIFLLIAFKPFFAALLTALVIFVLLRPVYEWLVKDTFIKNRYVVSGLMLILVTVFILVPTVLIGQVMLKEINQISGSVTEDVALTDVVTRFELGVEQFTGRSIDVEPIVQELSLNFFSSLTSSLTAILRSVTGFILSLVVMYFALFYLFVNSRKLKEVLKDFLPFNERNSRILSREFGLISNTMVLGLGITAIVQGLLISLGFVIFDIPGPVLWGFVGAIFSFLPFVGSAFVYVPAGVILLAVGKLGPGLGILLWGLILVAQSDNIIRIVVGKVVADIHPLIILLGVFIGLPVFGLIGVIIGPLLLSFFFTLIQMYRQEYT